MPEKISIKKTDTEFYKSAIVAVEHPSYAEATIYEEGPEFAYSSNGGQHSWFNRAVSIGLSKIFMPHTGVFDNLGATVANQITNVLKTRVGRNRQYDAGEVARYLRNAGSMYAMMMCLKNNVYVTKLIPRLAARNHYWERQRDLYDKYYNSVNVNWPVPESLAKFIEEYVVQICEDSTGRWNKGLHIFTSDLEVFNFNTTDETIDINFADPDADDILDLEGFIMSVSTGEQSQIARDLISYCKIKQLDALSNVTVYPLDGKHQATIVNTAKFHEVGIDLVDPYGDDLTGDAPHIGIASADITQVRLVSDEKAKNINYWDTLCRNSPIDFGNTGMAEIHCLVAIDHMYFRTADGEDEEDWDGQQLVRSTVLPSEIDEVELAINYIDLFGGIAMQPNNAAYITAMQVEPMGCKSYALSSRQLLAIQSIALQEVFNLKLLETERKQNEEKDRT